MSALAEGKGEKYGDVFILKMGENLDLPLQPTVTHVPNLTVDKTGDVETQGILVDMSTTDIHGGTLGAKFNLSTSRGNDCIQVVIPTSHETCAKQAEEIEKGCEKLNWKDANRAKARKKANQAIKDNNKMDHVNSWAFEIPTLTSSTGEALHISRKYFHETDKDAEGCTRLRVARKIVPGDITKEGQYIKVKGYTENDGKVPVSLAHFSFQLAFEDTEERIVSNEDEDDSESDEDLADAIASTRMADA